MMFDTVVTIVGNALNTPEWRRLESSQALVAKFRVAATSRKFDRDSGRWIDGPSLRVRVNCWRRLAENVVGSVISGDPVIVTGRIYSREWTGDDGQRRVSYELDAAAVGHDLARGKGTFTRQRPSLSTTVIEDGEPDERVGGELAERIDTPEAEASSDTEVSSDVSLAVEGDSVADEALSLLREAGVVDERPGGGAGDRGAGDRGAGEDGDDALGGDDDREAAAVSRRRRGRLVAAG